MLALAAVVAVAPGCSGGRPPAGGKPAAFKVQRVDRQPEPPGEAELEDGADYDGPAVLRNLPLAGTKWEWQGDLGRDTFETVDEPSLYRLEFKPNGWFDFQADCKHGAGMYEATGQRIALAVIKASRAACRQGSRADDFLGALEAAKAFRQAEDKLYIELKREPKTMVFGLKP